MELICFRHPEYRGEGSPELSCRNCCAIFSEAVRKRGTDRAKFQGGRAWLNAETKRGNDASKPRIH